MSKENNKDTFDYIIGVDPFIVSNISIYFSLIVLLQEKLYF